VCGFHKYLIGVPPEIRMKNNHILFLPCAFLPRQLLEPRFQRCCLELFPECAGRALCDARKIEARLCVAGFLSSDAYCDEGFAPFAREYVVQTWASNSSDNRTLELRFISSSDFPAGTPGGLKIQSHSEQPHPQKVRPSTQVNFRDERP
jgi:hypothetical protein